MAKYVTRQRKALIEFFEAHADKEMTARQIAEMIEGGPISVSAVYRNLSELEESGLVSRASRPGSREVYYRYVDPEDCRDCLHLSCTKCGKTIHMSPLEADFFTKSIQANERFKLDKTVTVLYGTCRECQNTGEAVK